MFDEPTLESPALNIEQNKLNESPDQQFIMPRVKFRTWLKLVPSVRSDRFDRTQRPDDQMINV
jgi:hypothetical protein